MILIFITRQHMHEDCIIVCLFIWGLTSLSTLYRSYTTGSWKGRGNQYIEFARVVYCKLPTNGKQLPAFPLTAMTGIDPRPQRWEARVLPLCHRGPCIIVCCIVLFQCSVNSHQSPYLNTDSVYLFFLLIQLIFYSNNRTIGLYHTSICYQYCAIKE